MMRHRGDHQHDGRDTVGRQDTHHNRFAAGVFKTDQRVRCEGAEYHINNHGGTGDDQTVDKIADDFIIAEGIPIPHQAPVLGQDGGGHLK